MDTLILILIIGGFWGLVCYKMAETRERDKTAGFVYGFIFGLFAVIVYLIGGDSDKKKKREILETIESYKKIL